MREIIYISLLAAALLLGNEWGDARAHEGHEGQHPIVWGDHSCQPNSEACDFPLGTHEHAVWWCGNKAEQGDCETPDQVSCSWTGTSCVPAQR